jgi:hypothetical protein
LAIGIIAVIYALGFVSQIVFLIAAIFRSLSENEITCGEDAGGAIPRELHRER